MKKLLVLLTLCFSLLRANAQTLPPSNMDVFDGCGMDGTAKGASLKKLNQLKNRYTAPSASKLNHSITLAALLAPGNDTKRWSSTSAAEVTGYIIEVKPGGPETVNCGKKDLIHADAHIDLVLTPTASSGSQRVIVEVTPRMRTIMRANGTDWSTTTLRKKILHKWIKVRGLMLFDTQHPNAAENTNPGGTKNWRATAWEIHPITSLQVVPAPAH